MKVFLAADHAGYELKEQLKQYVEELGHEAVDCGNTRFDPDDDYPQFILKAARAVAKGEGIGIILGGSGQAEAMTANRLSGVRAAVYYGPRRAAEAVDVTGRKSEDEYEIIKLSREHNDSNILSLGKRFMSVDEAKEAVRIWLETPFSHHPRHQRRIKQIDELSG